MVIKLKEVVVENNPNWDGVWDEVLALFTVSVESLTERTERHEHKAIDSLRHLQ